MYENIKEIIKSKDFELRDVLKKINAVWLKSYITEDEMKELEELARQNANAENSYAPLQEQINNIYAELDKIKADIEELKGEEEPTEPVEEYPDYKEPAGAHDAYNIGDKITYNGKKYICKVDGCVYSPDEYPPYWEEVIENVESEG